MSKKIQNNQIRGQVPGQQNPPRNQQNTRFTTPPRTRAQVEYFNMMGSTAPARNVEQAEALKRKTWAYCRANFA